MAAGGGAWKVAYADFVTAMMAFFMVMWLTSQKPEVKEAVASYFRDPFSFDTGPPKGDSKNEKGAEKPTLKPPRRWRQLQDQDPKRINQTDSAEYLLDTTRFSVAFDGTSTELGEDQKALVIERAPFLIGKGLRVEIRGHCVRIPLREESGIKTHWELCYARCLAVMKELEAHGVDPKYMRLSQAEDNEPITSGTTPEDVARNSRVDVYLLAQPVDEHTPADTGGAAAH